MEKQNITFNISTAAIVKVVIFALIILFLYLIKEVIMIIFVSLVLASAFDPWVDWFQRRKIPRGLAVLIIYIILFGVISLAFILVVPPVTREFTQLTQHFPDYYQKITGWIGNFQSSYNIELNSAEQLQSGIGQFGQSLTGTLSSVLNAVMGVFGGIVSIILVLVITFYLIVQETAMKGFIQSLAPAQYQPYLTRLYNRIQEKMGLWLRGQIVLSFVIFALTFIGLTILGMPYALVLAFLAGILEIVPFIGPLLSAIPAAFFGFLHSPFTGLSVIILYIFIQQLENHLIVPKVMSKAVGMNALVVILVILIGAKLSGVVGALLAVPVATGLSVFLKDIMEKRHLSETKLETD